MTESLEQVKTDRTAIISTSDNPMMALLEKVMTDPDLSVDKLEKFMDIQQKHEDREAEKRFNEALNSSQSGIELVFKNKHNSQTNSDYADYEAVNIVARPVYTKHGLSLAFTNFESKLEGHYGVRAELRHNAGYSKTYDANVPIDNKGIKGSVNKTATHAFGSSVSYGKRYLLVMIFNISTLVQDNDGNGPPVEFISDEQVEELERLIEDTGTSKIKFLKLGKIDTLHQISKHNFDGAKHTINESFRARQAKQ